MGLDPAPFSLRELYQMFRGRRLYEWDKITCLANRILPEVPFQNPYRESAPSIRPFDQATWDGFMSLLINR